jgi:hypothetical protein
MPPPASVFGIAAEFTITPIIAIAIIIAIPVLIIYSLVEWKYIRGVPKCLHCKDRSRKIL